MLRPTCQTHPPLGIGAAQWQYLSQLRCGPLGPRRRSPQRFDTNWSGNAYYIWRSLAPSCVMSALKGKASTMYTSFASKRARPPALRHDTLRQPGAKRMATALRDNHVAQGGAGAMLDDLPIP